MRSPRAIRSRPASADYSEGAEAAEEIRELTDAASDTGRGFRNEGRAFASFYLWHSVGLPGAFNFDEDQPLVAANAKVEGLQLSRIFDLTFWGAPVSARFPENSDRVTGWRRGD